MSQLPSSSGPSFFERVGPVSANLSALRMVLMADPSSSGGLELELPPLSVFIGFALSRRGRAADPHLNSTRAVVGADELVDVLLYPGHSEYALPTVFLGLVRSARLIGRAGLPPLRQEAELETVQVVDSTPEFTRLRRTGQVVTISCRVLRPSQHVADESVAGGITRESLSDALSVIEQQSRGQNPALLSTVAPGSPWDLSSEHLSSVEESSVGGVPDRRVSKCVFTSCLEERSRDDVLCPDHRRFVRSTVDHRRDAAGLVRRMVGGRLDELSEIRGRMAGLPEGAGQEPMELDIEEQHLAGFDYLEYDRISLETVSAVNDIHGCVHPQCNLFRNYDDVLCAGHRHGILAPPSRHIARRQIEEWIQDKIDRLLGPAYANNVFAGREGEYLQGFDVDSYSRFEAPPEVEALSVRREIALGFRKCVSPDCLQMRQGVVSMTCQVHSAGGVSVGCLAGRDDVLRSYLYSLRSSLSGDFILWEIGVLAEAQRIFLQHRPGPDEETMVEVSPLFQALDSVGRLATGCVVPGCQSVRYLDRVTCPEHRSQPHRRRLFTSREILERMDAAIRPILHEGDLPQELLDVYARMRQFFSQRQERWNNDLVIEERSSFEQSVSSSAHASRQFVGGIIPFSEFPSLNNSPALTEEAAYNLADCCAVGSCSSRRDAGYSDARGLFCYEHTVADLTDEDLDRRVIEIRRIINGIAGGQGSGVLINTMERHVIILEGVLAARNPMRGVIIPPFVGDVPSSTAIGPIAPHHSQEDSERRVLAALYRKYGPPLEEAANQKKHDRHIEL